jgi:hypothetical protein
MMPISSIKRLLQSPTLLTTGRRALLLPLLLGFTLGSPLGSAAEIAYLSAIPFEDKVPAGNAPEEKTPTATANPRNIGLVLLNKILADTDIAITPQSIPTMRVHQAIQRRTYPNWVLLAIETNDFKSFRDLADKYKPSAHTFELQCAIVSHHTTPKALHDVT